MSYTLAIILYDNSRLDRSSSIFSPGLCALTHRCMGAAAGAVAPVVPLPRSARVVDIACSGAACPLRYPYQAGRHYPEIHLPLNHTSRQVS